MRILLIIALILGITFPLFAQEKPPVNFVQARYYTPTKGRSIQYIVIHTVEGSFEGCISWFQSPKSEVSAHYVIGHDGRITQMVKDQDKAWHSGTTKYNQEAIGIEHEGWAHKNTWTDMQYRASASVSRYLCLKYNIPIDRAHIISHAEIAPSRRSDPGPYFDWDYYIRLVKGDGSAPRPVSEEEKKERERIFTEANNAHRDGNYKDAYKKYSELAYNDPESPIAKVSKARLEEYKKQFDLIKSLMDQLAEEDQEEALEMVKKMLQTGEEKEAKFLADKMTATYPNSKYFQAFQNFLKELKEREKKLEAGKEASGKEGAVDKLKKLEGK